MPQSIYEKSFMAGLKPEAKMTVSEWADKHRMLSQASSAEPGRWRTSRTPYLREIMDCLSSMSMIQRVVFQAGAQVGKTETGNNWTGYIVDHSPGPMMLVQPTVDLAKRLSKQRIAPMIEETPVLRDKISEPRSRDSGNTMLAKEFPGGIMVIVGANSAVGLRSMPVRYLFLDEIDAFPDDVNGEGDPIKLAERRTTTFSRRKIYISSTPTIKDISKIEKEYQASDRRKYHVPCPHCGNMAPIEWKNIKWDDNDPKTAALLCENCGVLISESHKTTMLNHGEWRATAPGDGLTAGFHLSSLYSPLGWKSWAEIVAEFIAAKDDRHRLKEWVNTVLAETWDDEYSANVGASELSSREEEYEYMKVPQGGLILTAGVDVQDNRLAVVVRAWGQGEESWLVYWGEIYGDPSDMGPNGPWAQVDSILDMDFMHVSEKPMKIKAMAIDSGGHFTNEVYMYARMRRQRYVLAVKGASTVGRPAIGRPTKIDFAYRGREYSHKSGGGVLLYVLGVHAIKNTISSRFKNAPTESKKNGPGMYHWPIGVNDDYYTQLVAEKRRIVRYKDGNPIWAWVKRENARNEAWDCEVYAYAALHFIYTTVADRNSVWLKAEKDLNRLDEGKKSKIGTPSPDSPRPPPRPNKFSSPRRRNGFVQRW
jgi:phage terminase large subunit GpA-like protein